MTGYEAKQATKITTSGRKNINDRKRKQQEHATLKQIYLPTIGHPLLSVTLLFLHSKAEECQKSASWSESKLMRALEDLCISNAPKSDSTACGSYIPKRISCCSNSGPKFEDIHTVSCNILYVQMPRNGKCYSAYRQIGIPVDLHYFRCSEVLLLCAPNISTKVGVVNFRDWCNS